MHRDNTGPVQSPFGRSTGGGVHLVDGGGVVPHLPPHHKQLSTAHNEKQISNGATLLVALDGSSKNTNCICLTLVGTEQAIIENATTWQYID